MTVQQPTNLQGELRAVAIIALIALIGYLGFIASPSVTQSLLERDIEWIPEAIPLSFWVADCMHNYGVFQELQEFSIGLERDLSLSVPALSSSHAVLWALFRLSLTVGSLALVAPLCVALWWSGRTYNPNRPSPRVYFLAKEARHWAIVAALLLTFLPSSEVIPLIALSILIFAGSYFLSGAYRGI